VGDEVVDAVLARALKKHAEAACRTRLNTEYLSDYQDDDDDGNN
jgi:hypothetical protein